MLKTKRKRSFAFHSPYDLDVCATRLAGLAPQIPTGVFEKTRFIKVERLDADHYLFHLRQDAGPTLLVEIKGTLVKTGHSTYVTGVGRAGLLILGLIVLISLFSVIFSPLGLIVALFFSWIFFDQTSLAHKRLYECVLDVLAGQP
ncbi:MAG TPA: hypothetical protein VHP83_00260 [Aggregatilineaceae bacterium]|nr:hypothetical protein [Aggregatilineaceae bacterium]